MRAAGAGVAGIGAAACAACCAGPILGALGAIGLASAAGFLLAGSVAIVAGLLAAAVLVARRRRRPGTCGAATGPVPVELGARPATTGLAGVAGSAGHEPT